MKKKLDVYNGYLMAVSKAQSLLSFKFATQLNMWDRRKIGYNFAFMFASPPYVTTTFRNGSNYP
jgi:hypothetical protein